MVSWPSASCSLVILRQMISSVEILFGCSFDRNYQYEVRGAIDATESGCLKDKQRINLSDSKNFRICQMNNLVHLIQIPHCGIKKEISSSKTKALPPKPKVPQHLGRHGSTMYDKSIFPLQTHKLRTGNVGISLPKSPINRPLY